MGKGKLIVLEGIDGSGKSAQYRRLCARLENDKIGYHHIVFPRYEKDSSALIRMYLGGHFGAHPSDVHAYAASTFYAVDRYASFRMKWQKYYEAGDIILADRYTTSNAIHQCSKLPKERWDVFLDWLFTLEYALMGIPTPDLVIYLQGDTEISQKLMTERYHGDESKKDIHEKDLEYMNRSRKAAEYCKDALGWTTVHCVRDGEMRGIEEIHEEIMNLISEE